MPPKLLFSISSYYPENIDAFLRVVSAVLGLKKKETASDECDERISIMAKEVGKGCTSISAICTDSPGNINRTQIQIDIFMGEKPQPDLSCAFVVKEGLITTSAWNVPRHHREKAFTAA